MTVELYPFSRRVLVFPQGVLDPRTHTSRGCGRGLQPLASLQRYSTKIAQDRKIVIEHFNRCMNHNAYLIDDIGFPTRTKQNVRLSFSHVKNGLRKDRVRPCKPAA